VSRTPYGRERIGNLEQDNRLFQCYQQLRDAIGGHLTSQLSSPCESTKRGTPRQGRLMVRAPRTPLAWDVDHSMASSSRSSPRSRSERHMNVGEPKMPKPLATSVLEAYRSRATLGISASPRSRSDQSRIVRIASVASNELFRKGTRSATAHMDCAAFG